MNKAEEVLRTYINFEDANGSKPITLLPLTIIDAMEEYATIKLQEKDEAYNELLNDFELRTKERDEQAKEIERLKGENEFFKKMIRRKQQLNENSDMDYGVGDLD
jgi:hypothetical protein